MTSATYQLFRRAILDERRVAFDYDGSRREVCPLVIGRGKGVEKVLTYQLSGPPKPKEPKGEGWRCFEIAKVAQAEIGDGPWHEGGSHKSDQTCVEEVDLDINIHVRHLR